MQLGKHAKDITGQKFGKLTAIEPVGINPKDGSVRWRCVCECGNENVVSAAFLRNGNTKTCGCGRKGKTVHLTHGYTNTPLYRCWSNMKTRCENPNSKAFKWYGARGITVCAAWESFAPFMEWALRSGYSPELEIDRIDNNKGYGPDNCRFVTHKENCNNRRNSHANQNSLEKTN